MVQEVKQGKALQAVVLGLSLMCREVGKLPQRPRTLESSSESRSNSDSSMARGEQMEEGKLPGSVVKDPTSLGVV